MAKIDSVGRMLLPPDPGIKSQAFSARERATSEPVVRALTEWFKTIQQGRRGDTDKALLQAVRSVLTDSARTGEPAPRAIAGEVKASIPYQEVKGGRPGQLYYQVQIGQSTVVVNSKAPLAAGQALILTPGKDQPQLLLPQTPAQARLILALVQQLQVTHLPTPQSSTPLPANHNGLFELLRAPTKTAAPMTPQSTQPSIAGASPATAGSAEGLVNQTLSRVLSQWLSALPGTGSPPSAESGSAPARAELGQRLALSNHWIPQLIQAARVEYGSATAQTVRQVWQQWQAGVREQLLPVVQAANPASASANASNPTTAATPNIGGRANAAVPTSAPPPMFQVMTPAANNVALALPLPLQTSPLRNADPANNILQQLAGLLKGGTDMPAQTDTSSRPSALTTAATSNPAGAPTETRDTVGRVPADVWRVLAEQLVDTRLQQLGQPAPTSLQALLHRQAEVLRAQQMTYSPQQLKQLLRTPTGGLTPQQTAQAPEQQALQQLRQLLDQVTQQQQARTVAPNSSDPGSEPPRQVQGLPIMHDQQLVWFDLERQPTPKEDDATGKQSERRWVLDLHFHLSPMAPICARLRWQGSHGDIEFLTDDMPTLRALHAHTPSLQAQLKQQGLPIEDIHCRHGLPKRAQDPTKSAGTAPDSGGQIDVHT